MSKKIITLFIVGFMLLSFSFIMDAGQRSPNFAKKFRFGIKMAEKNLFSGRMLLRLKDKIGLTSEQVQKIEKMQTLYYESQIRGKSDLKVLELRFNSYLKTKKVNRTKVEKMIREIAKIKTDLQVDHFNYLLDLRSLLTPEQIKKIEEIKVNFRRNALRRVREKRARTRHIQK